MWRRFAILAFIYLNYVASLPYVDIKLKDIKTSADRIREHGYPVESHFVETEDGYILNLFRIPYSPRIGNQNVRKPIVFLQHGLFSCSDGFLLNGPDNALAYNFVDSGFDVWLGNARGNIYSRNNTKISLMHPDFWKFGWHEIGIIDTPTMIDYILMQTGESSLHYVGHSQGATVFFVMASILTEYNEKIKSAHLLAPSAFMGNVTHTFVSNFGPYFGVPDSLYEQLFSDQEFLPYNHFLQRFLDTICGGNPKFPEYCETFFLLWADTDQFNVNRTLLPQLAETHPASISTNQAIHYMQLYVSNTFRRFDYGVKRNRVLYGQETPPDYELERITSPVYIYYGLSDGSSHAKDVIRLPDHLQSIKFFHEVPDPTWGHFDFLFALQVKEVINDVVIKFCLDYEKNS